MQIKFDLYYSDPPLVDLFDIDNLNNESRIMVFVAQRSK